MKTEQKINNQWRILHKIFNNEKGIFDWDDMKLAIRGLLYLKIIRINPYYFDKKEE